MGVGPCMRRKAQPEAGASACLILGGGHRLILEFEAADHYRVETACSHLKGVE